MCAVIGVLFRNPSQQDLTLVENVIRESSIRGLHATGLSWVRGDQIQTRIDAVPASQFLEQFDLNKAINEDDSLYLIGHCRYSTSDLEYNQPLWNKNVSIVHNGVITQEMPENWERLYGYKFKTKNDSELIVHTLSAQKSPLEEFPDSSMSVVELYAEKRIRFYRNGKRPIYFTSLPNGVIITSTSDIAKRAGLGASSEVPMDTYIEVKSDLSLHMKYVPTGRKDLQP